MERFPNSFTSILLLCRPGFESEVAQEIQHFAATLDIYGYIKAESRTGLVFYNCFDVSAAEMLLCQLEVDDLIFVRDLMLVGEKVQLENREDRIGQLLPSILPCTSIGHLEALTLDSNDGKSLARLSKKLLPPLKQALKAESLWSENSEFGLAILFDDDFSGWLGFTLIKNRPKWPSGIAHLRMPKQGPSRSTLKLDEAILFFLNDQQQSRWFGLGKTAVDLGACPGGWTYQLVRRDCQVFAIDNGEIDPKLMATGQIEHLKVDGFHYRPPYKVNWLVCDMVEKPIRIAELMAKWLARGDAERAIFNLKLPMKKRFEEVLSCKEAIEHILGDMNYTIKMKHLYHDREEITVFLDAGSET